MNKILIGALSAAAAIVLSGCATTANTAKNPDAAVDAFLRDYVGVQFGDDISKINGYEDTQYMIPMQKKFLYFTKAACYYRKGKLYRIQIIADIGSEYSLESTDAKLRKSITEFGEIIGLPQSHFMHNYHNYREDSLWSVPTESIQPNIKMSYIVDNATINPSTSTRRYAIGFVDTKLDRLTKTDELPTPQYKPATNARRRSWGASLPDAD